MYAYGSIYGSGHSCVREATMPDEIEINVYEIQPWHGDRDILKLIHRLANENRQTLHRIETTMATQADIDALTAALTADDAAIATEIANLQTANPSLDLTALSAAVAATAALVPAATTPAA